MMHKEDLKRVAPMWLQFSKAVRHDPDVGSFSSSVCAASSEPRLITARPCMRIKLN